MVNNKFESQITTLIYGLSLYFGFNGNDFIPSILIVYFIFFVVYLFYSRSTIIPEFFKNLKKAQLNFIFSIFYFLLTLIVGSLKFIFIICVCYWIGEIAAKIF